MPWRQCCSSCWVRSGFANDCRPLQDRHTLSVEVVGQVVSVAVQHLVAAPRESAALFQGYVACNLGTHPTENGGLGLGLPIAPHRAMDHGSARVKHRQRRVERVKGFAVGSECVEGRGREREAATPVLPVHARGGQLYVFADAGASMDSVPGVNLLRVSETDEVVAPIVFTIPLQMLAYYVAIIKGTDVDQPRNLAKSVTVE